MPPTPRMNLTISDSRSPPNTPPVTSTPPTSTSNGNSIMADDEPNTNNPSSPSKLDTNNLDDSEYNPEHLDQSTIKRRARSHWNLIKSLHATQKKSQRLVSQRAYFKMGEKISLTTAEATFLNMVTKSRLDVDHRSFSGGGGSAAAAAAAVRADFDGEQDQEDDDHQPIDELAVSGRTHFSHLVQAAVAKERLRDAIKARLADLSGAESRFLSKLVANKEVTLEALENTVHVLDNDPLYNPTLRTKSEFISEFNVGVIDEEDDESDDDDDEEEKITAKDIMCESSVGTQNNQRGVFQRRDSGIQCSALFDKAMETDDSERSVSGLDLSERTRKSFRRTSSVTELNVWKIAKGTSDDDGEKEAHDVFPSSDDAIDSSLHSQLGLLDSSTRNARSGLDKSARSKVAGLDASTRSRARRASTMEQNMWKLAQQDKDQGGSPDRLGQSARSPRSRRASAFVPGVVEGGSPDRLSQSARTPRRGLQNRRASAAEKSVWQLVHGESIDEVDSYVAEQLEEAEDEDGLPVKSMFAGETMDPLLMAAPVEMTPMIQRKSLGDADGSNAHDMSNVKDEKVGLDQLLSSEARVNVPPKFPGAQSIAESFADPSQDVQSRLSICCGMDTMLLDGIINDPDAAANESGPVTEENEKVDSIASKKRYLHLDTAMTNDEVAAETDQHESLSTWMGAPEDYPILGLAKKDVDGEDPLEPHVLSPLLMKCLRDHLPYALREENFWLKYSLVRDGASLDSVFSIMRHSQHAVLAIETSTGEVFGSFTSSAWRANGNNYYGSCEAFVWMLRKSRRNANGEESCHTLDEYVLRESSLEVSKWNGKDGNRNVQLSNQKKLFVGGGNPDADGDDMSARSGSFHLSAEQKENDDEAQWGMALALDKDLLRGTSSRCATFASNPLIDRSRHEGSEVFEIMNMEIWALTPCMSEEMAEELELGRTFVMGLHKES